MKYTNIPMEGILVHQIEGVDGEFFLTDFGNLSVDDGGRFRVFLEGTLEVSSASGGALMMTRNAGESTASPIPGGILTSHAAGILKTSIVSPYARHWCMIGRGRRRMDFVVHNLEAGDAIQVRNGCGLLIATGSVSGHAAPHQVLSNTGDLMLIADQKSIVVTYTQL